MSEFQILSNEEVDAILKVSEEKTDLSQVLGGHEDHSTQCHSALNNIIELTRAECEKNLSGFLRKRIVIKAKEPNLAELSSCLDGHGEKKIFSIFRMLPNDVTGLFDPDLSFLHQAINLLYGGQIESHEATIESPGKVGAIIAEKIGQLCLDAFSQACQEYGTIQCEITKTNVISHLLPQLSVKEQVYQIELVIVFDDLETTVKFMIPEDFMNVFIPEKTGEVRHREKDFWRKAIKSQVVDSLVSVSVALPDVSLKVSEFMALKEGDTIPISDPTLVYVCLNNIKLFRATAGQSNSKMFAKITRQI